MIKNTYRVFYKQWKDYFDHFSVFIHLPEVSFGRFGISETVPFAWDRKPVFVLDFTSTFFIKKDPDLFCFSLKVLGFGFTILRQWGWGD